MVPNLEAADETMPSQQLENNGPQSMVICCPVQGKDIKAPEVQVLWRNNRLGRKAPLQRSPAMARSAGLVGILPNEPRKQRWLCGFLLSQVSLRTRETRRQVGENGSEEHGNST